MTKREFLDTVFALAPNEANAIMDAFDEYVDSNEPHWIPVTERLPEVGQDVMFSVHDVYSAGVNDHSEGTSCEYCRYEDVREEDEPCCNCSHSHIDMFAPKVKDDEIEVGDVVQSIDGNEFVVVGINNDYGNTCGFTKAGLWVGYATDRVKKTDKHYDNKSILEDMQE